MHLTLREMVPKTRSVFGIVATDRERFARLVRYDFHLHTIVWSLKSSTSNGSFILVKYIGSEYSFSRRGTMNLDLLVALNLVFSTCFFKWVNDLFSKALIVRLVIARVSITADSEYLFMLNNISLYLTLREMVPKAR